MTPSITDQVKTSLILRAHDNVHSTIDHLDTLLSQCIPDWGFKQSVHDITPSLDLAAGRKILDIVKAIECRESMKGYLSEPRHQELGMELISRLRAIRNKVRWGEYNSRKLDQAAMKVAEWIREDVP